MKIIIEKTLLENILVHAQTFLEKKDTSQITAHVYIKVQNNALTLKATDHEIGLEIHSEDIQVEEDGIITANGKKFLDIIKILKNAPISLTSDETTLTIKQNHSNFKLPMFKSSEFPLFPHIDDISTMQIEANKLVNAFKKITSSADNNNPKFELNGALIDIQENQINFVATDTRRLSVVTLEQKSEEVLSLIIPKKSIIEIQKLFFDKIQIIYNHTYLIIKSKQFTFFTKLINGKYPDYRRIIPNETKHTFELPKSDIIDAIKQITTISTDMKVTFSKNSINFESLSEDNIEAKTNIIINTPFENDYTIAINSRYILDFLAQIEYETFTIYLNEPNLPFVLESANFKTIVMPIVI